MDPTPPQRGPIEPSERFKGFDPAVVESVLATLEMTIADLDALERAAGDRVNRAKADHARIAGEVAHMETRRAELSAQIAVLEARLAECRMAMERVHDSLGAVIGDDDSAPPNLV